MSEYIGVTLRSVKDKNVLKQCVSMDSDDPSGGKSTALVPLPGPSVMLNCDPDLTERIRLAAATLGCRSPSVIPGAAALIVPLSLPLKTDRQRRAALPFAMEDHLSEPLENLSLALGPQLENGDWIGVAASADYVGQAIIGHAETGPVIPDILAVPLPSRAQAWAVWCGHDAIYLRFADGGGLVTRPHGFVDLWKAFDKPPLDVVFGQLPSGFPGQFKTCEPPSLDEDVLRVDLRSPHQQDRPSWFGQARFAVVVILATMALHIALLWADATALDQIAQTRWGLVEDRLTALGLSGAVGQPVSVIIDDLVTQSEGAPQQERFLPLLSNVLVALPDGLVTFQELQYDSASGQISMLLQAGDLEALQRAEEALQSNGILAQSGAATRHDAGADVQIIVSEAL